MSEDLILNRADLSQQLCDILGLNANRVTRLVLNLEVGRFTIFVEMLPTQEQYAKLNDLKLDPAALNGAEVRKEVRGGHVLP